MAQPVALTQLSAWSEYDVKVGTVLDALAGLRRGEVMPATRASVLTLVIVAREIEAARAAERLVHDLGGRHPARLLTLLLEDDVGSRRGLDAELQLLGGSAEGRDLYFEDIELRVRGPAAKHLDSLIEPFTLPDLPVVAWFTEELPAPDDPLVDAIDVVLVDTRVLGNSSCFPAIRALSRRRPVVDLSWVRLRPWREQLAGLFEGAEFRPFVSGVDDVLVTGHDGPRHILAGWLRERLAVRAEHLHLDAAEHVTIRLGATDARGRRASFEVDRPSDERMIVARAAIDGGPATEALVPLPPRRPAWGLAEALSFLGHDRVYERALDHLPGAVP